MKRRTLLGAAVATLAACATPAPEPSRIARLLAALSLDQRAGQTMAIGVDENQAVGTFSVAGSHPLTKGVVARATAGQIGALVEAQDPTGNSLSRFDANGYLVTAKTTPPNPATLANGELALYLDPTVGATRLVLVARDAVGILRTGAIALT